MATLKTVKSETRNESLVHRSGMDIRIYYEDTDCAGVVYYANYLKYFERARTHYLDERGISVHDLLQKRHPIMVVRAQVDYRSPAHYGETLFIETRVSERGNATMTFAHVIRERASGRIVVEGCATLAAVNQDGKIQRLPRSLLDMPASIQTRTPKTVGRERPAR